jgi:hypothetical protein
MLNSNGVPLTKTGNSLGGLLINRNARFYWWGIFLWVVLELEILGIP